jgi:hypothetical protein
MSVFNLFRQRIINVCVVSKKGRLVLHGAGADICAVLLQVLVLVLVLVLMLVFVLTCSGAAISASVEAGAAAGAGAGSRSFLRLPKLNQTQSSKIARHLNM